jgi:hypothetical protein
MTEDFFPGNAAIVDAPSSPGQYTEEILSLEDLSLSSSHSSVMIEWDLLSSAHSSEWDIVSEVLDLQSVKSFDSLPFSYKDALLVKQSSMTAAGRPVINKKHQTLVKRDTMILVVQQDKDTSTEGEENYDPFFILNGHKGARGGRAISMFNTNQRHAPQGNPHRNRENRDMRRRARRYLKTDVGSTMNAMRNY